MEECHQAGFFRIDSTFSELTDVISEGRRTKLVSETSAAEGLENHLDQQRPNDVGCKK
jgi:hypothetical protein